MMALETLPGSRASRGRTFLSSRRIVVETMGAPGFSDVTDQVAEIVRRAEVIEGLALVFSRHTTAAICINENEPLLLADLADWLTRLAPRDGRYRHDDFSVRTANMTPDEQPNGHAHCLRLLLPTSELIPIENGTLALGTWQRIFLVELDRPRRREVDVRIITG